MPPYLAFSLQNVAGLPVGDCCAFACRAMASVLAAHLCHSGGQVTPCVRAAGQSGRAYLSMDWAAVGIGQRSERAAVGAGAYGLSGALTRFLVLNANGLRITAEAVLVVFDRSYGLRTFLGLAVTYSPTS